MFAGALPGPLACLSSNRLVYEAGRVLGHDRVASPVLLRQDVELLDGVGDALLDVAEDVGAEVWGLGGEEIQKLELLVFVKLVNTMSDIPVVRVEPYRIQLSFRLNVTSTLPSLFLPPSRKTMI